ncbi:Arabinanase/levansucrase/invertase [Meredithblackwellia eburnea MCA 4105]
MPVSRPFWSAPFLTQIFTVGLVLLSCVAKAELDQFSKQLVPRATTTYPDSLPLAGALVPHIHDPSAMIKSRDGKKWILFGTGNKIRIRTSTDRVNWVDAGYVWSEKTRPKAALKYMPKDSPIEWAPDISFHNGWYWLYYAASTWNSNKSGIFAAKSKTGLSGSWINLGLIIDSDPSVPYNCIDPSLAVDLSGNWHLVFGSYISGIYLLDLDKKTGLPKNKAHPRQGLTHLAQRFEDYLRIEAPFLFKHNGWWWLFTSFGGCCDGQYSTYSVTVARSRSVYGPFKDQSGKPSLQGGGTQILATHTSKTQHYWGPGAQSVFKDGNKVFMVYHFSGLTNKEYHIGLNELDFSSGWPKVI